VRLLFGRAHPRGAVQPCHPCGRAAPPAAARLDSGLEAEGSAGIRGEEQPRGNPTVAYGEPHRGAVAGESDPAGCVDPAAFRAGGPRPLGRSPHRALDPVAGAGARAGAAGHRGVDPPGISADRGHCCAAPEVDWLPGVGAVSGHPQRSRRPTRADDGGSGTTTGRRPPSGLLGVAGGPGGGVTARQCAPLSSLRSDDTSSELRRHRVPAS
jgi:hypothetical protein